MKMERIDCMINFNKTFAEAFRAGEISCDNIDDYVEYWHTHDTCNGLQEFLGMTKDEYVKWIFGRNDILFEILGVEPEPVEIPVCVICGIEMGVKTACGIIMKSCYNGTDTCDDCQLEYCLSTNCLGCEIGNYPECEHLYRKKFYMEEERREREEEKKEGNAHDGE